MEQSSIHIAVVSNMLASFTLAFCLLFLWRQQPKTLALALWAAGYLLHAVRQALVIAGLYDTPYASLALDLVGPFPPLLFLAGTLRLIDRPIPYVAGGLIAAALIALALFGHLIASSPTIPLLGQIVTIVGVVLATGVVLIRHHRREPDAGHFVLGVLFCLWALLIATFVVVRNDPTLRTGYYMASALLLVVIALAFVMVSQRQQYIEARRARDAAEAASQRFQDVVDTATAWIWEWDAERRIRFISPQVHDSLGIKPEAFIGRRILEVPGIARVELPLDDIDRVFTRDRPFRNVPVEVVTGAGRRVRISVTGKPIFDDAGRHTGFRGITIDVTETERLRTMLDAIAAAVAPAVGDEYFSLLVERLAKDLRGDHAVVGRCLPNGRVRTLAAYVNGDQLPPMEYALAGTPSAKVLAEGACLIEEGCSEKFPDDTRLAGWGIEGYAAVALRDRGGAVIGLVAVLSKARLWDPELIRSALAAVAPRAGAELERQTAEAALRDSEARFRAVIDGMPIGFHLMDADRRYVLRNRTLAEWTGTEVSSFIGKTLSELSVGPQVHHARVDAEVQEVLRSGQALIHERPFVGINGIGRPALTSRFPIRDETGKIAFVASFINDLTDVRHLEAQVREREQLFRTVIDNTPMAFQITDADTRLVLANRTLRSWMGRYDDTLLGRTFRENGLPATRCDVVEAEHREVAANGRTLTYEGEFVPLEGEKRPALIFRFPIAGPDGGRPLVGTVALDLSALRQLQREVQEREALFHTVIDNMPIGFLLTDGQGRIARRNKTLQSWSQRDSQLTIGQIPGDPEVEAELREVVESRKQLIRERVLSVEGDKPPRPVLVFRFPIFDSAGTLSFVATLVTDLSESKRLEAQVREREALFRAVIDNMPIRFHLTDAEGRVVEGNRLHDEGSKEVVFGKTFSEMDTDISPKDRAIIDEEIRQVRETGRTLMRESVDQLNSRGPRPVLVCRFPIHDAAGNVKLVASMITDLSDLKRLENQVRQGEARLQRIVAALDRSQMGVVVEDESGRPIYVNRTAGDLMGGESSAVAMLRRAGVGSEFEANDAWTGEVIHRTRNGSDAILQASISRLPDGSSVTLLGDATDRLERERRQTALERQVQEAQKMDAVGQLAGGIAHDFNNLIGAILGFARFIAEDTEERSRVHGYATRILSASQRARELIQQILAFSRRENAPRQPAAIAKLVEESAQLLRATVPAALSIEVRNEFPEAWSIVNQTQITQILVNLCLNAADAMAGKPGTLTLALERLPDLDPRLRRLLASDPGSLPRVDIAADADQPSRCYVGALRTGMRYLVLSVRDQGTGIPLELLPKIFDPFVTTKPRGQGTGLGLSVVQRLVLAHEGAIVVTTLPGAGTAFDIILPVSERSNHDIVEAVTRVEGEVLPAAPSGRRGRILVVDDDLHFGDMVSTALDRAGYEVGVCGRPSEAIEVFTEQPTLWDVLVTDQTMPEMSGLEMIGRLKTLNPALRCILCTGYASGGLNAATARAGGADVFFHKPIDVEALTTTIASLVSEGESGGSAD